MDPANPNMNASHVQHESSNYGGFLNGITDYSAYEDNQHNDNDDGQFKWDPELFAAAEAFTQPSSEFSQAFVQHESRQQSNSPALPAYSQQQHGFPQNQFHQQVFANRTPQIQPTYTSQFMSRPSHSPAPFEQFQYPNQMPPHVQNFNPPSMQPQRQSSATPQAFQKPTAYDAFGVFNSKPSPVHQTQPPTMNYFHEFPDQGRQATSRFVDPSVLSTSTFTNPNLSPAELLARQRQSQANNQQQPQRTQFDGSQYLDKQRPFDPRAVQYAHLQNQSQLPATAQRPQPYIKIPAPGDAQQASIRAMKDPNAPKRPRGRPRKDGSAPRQRKDGQTSASGSESDSGDELEVEEEPPEITPAILTVSAPTDERGKALYSAVQAVWTPRNRPATPEKIRNGIASFGEVVRSLRDSWKTKNDNLKKAELPNSATALQAAHLKDEVQRYRASMESIMVRANHFGHPAVVKRLGENQFTMSALYSFLLDRFNAGDYDSSLVTSILKFATRFETLDDNQLDTTKWSKILQRFAKKATNESKNHAQTILSNAAKVTASKGSAATNGEKLASPVPSGGSDTVVGIKRTRDGEAVSGSMPKKVVKPLPQSSKPLALQNAERRKALEKAQAARDKDAKTMVAAIATAAKPKVAAVVPTKSAVFSALLSASKKPGTSNAARAAAAKEKPDTGVVPVALKKDVKEDSPTRKLGASSAGNTSSFMGFLADVEKKQEPEAKKEVIMPDESEEDKAKRLRKEARRKLRVSWRADSDLVETRLFTHDPQEDSGQTGSMMRDAGDTGKEGEMLKLHKGLEDLDDDDDEDEEGPVEDINSYTMPTSVDVSEADEDFKFNCIKFNGPIQAESPASEAQNKHEENNLMVVFAVGSERPNTPREPEAESDDTEFQPCVDFGEPDAKTREREKEYLARLPKPAPPMSGLDFAAQLRAMTSAQPSTQPNMGNLQQTLTLLGGQPQQAQPPAAGTDLSKLLNFVQNFQHLQQQPQAQPAYQAPQPPAVTPNLAALLAQMSSQPQNQALPTGTSGNPNPFPGADDMSRKHARNDSADEYNKKNKKKKGADGLPYNYKTQVCTFWLEGKCIKGDSCTYRHDDG